MCICLSYVAITDVYMSCLSGYNRYIYLSALTYQACMCFSCVDITYVYVSLLCGHNRCVYISLMCIIINMYVHLSLCVDITDMYLFFFCSLSFAHASISDGDTTSVFHVSACTLSP